MLSNVVQLFKHLRRAGRLFAYLKLLIWRHRDILAYVILALSIIVTFHRVQVQNDNFNAKIVQTGIEGRQASCDRDVKLTKNIRSILETSVLAVEAQHTKHIITDEQYSRAIAFYKDALHRLPIPDCVQYVQNYKNTVKDITP